MRHLKRVSNLPAPAQTSGLCEDITTEGQAKFCFVLSFLEGFLLPVIEMKGDTTTPQE